LSFLEDIKEAAEKILGHKLGSTELTKPIEEEDILSMHDYFQDKMNADTPVILRPNTYGGDD